VITNAGPTKKQHEAMVEAILDPVRARVYASIFERPGVTVAQIARRLDEPARRVRHQIDYLVGAGLVFVDSKTVRRNAREHHYRAVVRPSVLSQEDDSNTDDERRKLAVSALRCLLADIARAVRDETFGRHAGHAEVRVPGEVDQRGWDEVARLMDRTTAELEDIMTRSAVRLEAAGEGGVEVIAALLFFEAPGWDPPGELPKGPRPSSWLQPSEVSHHVGG
jgi:DNA-binding transcriptional ArsR family regulator